MAARKCGADSEEEDCIFAVNTANQAASSAVAQVFAILGVDVNEPREVEEFRQNLRFGATLRRAADKGLFAFVGACMTLIVAALVSGIASKFGG